MYDEIIWFSVLINLLKENKIEIKIFKYNILEKKTFKLFLKNFL